MSDGTKVCPRCGQRLFEDMDVCYGCLYDFRRGEPTESCQVGPDVGQLPMQGADALTREGAAPTESLDIPGDSAAGEARHGGGPGYGGGRGGQHLAPCAPEGDIGDEVLAHATGSAAVPCRTPPAGTTSAGTSKHSPDDTLDLAAEARTGRRPLCLRVRSASMDACIPIPAAGLTVGRAPGNDVVLHVRAVSRQHLRIVPRGVGAVAEDRGATNPATLHGKPIEGAADLVPGDVVDVCGVTLSLVR